MKRLLEDISEELNLGKYQEGKVVTVSIHTSDGGTGKNTRGTISKLEPNKEMGEIVEVFAVTGKPEDIEAVKKVLAVASMWCAQGHSGTIKLHIDGDGAARIHLRNHDVNKIVQAIPKEETEEDYSVSMA